MKLCEKTFVLWPASGSWPLSSFPPMAMSFPFGVMLRVYPPPKPVDRSTGIGECSRCRKCGKARAKF